MQATRIELNKKIMDAMSDGGGQQRAGIQGDMREQYAKQKGQRDSLRFVEYRKQKRRQQNCKPFSTQHKIIQ
jgi:hypothetical protein